MDYREENGKFTSRSQLLKVAKLGPKAFEQCAGFMRISDGKNPLDATGVHPESYDATKAVLEKLGYTMEDVKNRNVVGISKRYRITRRSQTRQELVKSHCVISLKSWKSRHVTRVRICQSQFYEAMSLR